MLLLVIMTAKRHLTSLPAPTMEAVVADLFSEVDLAGPLSVDAIHNAEQLTELVGQDLAWVKENGLRTIEPGLGPRFSPKVTVRMPEGDEVEACLLIVHQLSVLPPDATPKGTNSFVLDIAPSVGTPTSGYFDRVAFNTGEPDKFKIFYNIDLKAREALIQEHPVLAKLDEFMPEGDMRGEEHTILDDFEFEDETSLYVAFVLHATVEALKSQLVSTAS